MAGNFVGGSTGMGGIQRPPNVQVGEGIDWRHMMMNQQQNMNFNNPNPGIRPNFSNTQGKNLSINNIIGFKFNRNLFLRF